MQQRQLIWLAGSLIVLLALAVISGTFDKEISTVNVPALSISSDQIERFEIVTSDSSVYNLTKEKGKWRITAPIEAPADSLTVSRFTQNLDDMRLESVVSTNANKYETYGVSELGKHINIAWGRNKKTFYIGNSGPDYQSFYVRLGSDPRIFLSTGRLNVPENLDTWRDKTVIDLPGTSVNQIAVSAPGFAYELTKTGMSWEISEDGDNNVADSTKIVQMLNRYAPLKAMAFVDDMPATQIKSEATHQIHFSVPGGSTQTIWLVHGETELVATATGKDATFRLTKTLLSSFIPPPEDLVEE